MVRWLIICALLVAGLFVSLHLLFPLPPEPSYSTVIKNNKGEIIHAFLSPDEKWRMKTSLEEISPLLRKTIVRKEDKFYYYHTGVNPFALARALMSNLLHLKRTSGASTITMQVARALERKPRTYKNKLIEIFRAWQLELKYNKNEILALYCNLLPYGGNIEGVKAASWLYLQKDPDHLSLAEITALSIIPNRPTSLVPGRNNEAIRIQRDVWLKRFARDGVFSGKQVDDALAEPFDARRHAFPRRAPHLARMLARSYSGEITTTLDLHLQSQAENIISDYTRLLRTKNITNAASIIIDNRTHQVLAYVGSSDFYDSLHAGQVDGVKAVRQPGSTLKPFIYGLAIDAGLMTPGSVTSDVPVSYEGYAPENFNRQFNGLVTMEHALEHSLNIPAVKALKDIGTTDLVQALSSSGFMQVRKDNRKLGLSMALGGCGASLAELTAAYASLANGGMYHEPVFTAEHSGRYRYRLMSEPAAFMISNILSRVSRPDFPLNWQATEHMPKIAWKTGTSYGRRDAWSIGYNRRYTIGVWTGNFSAQGSPDLSGAETATPLLFRLFNTLDYDGEGEWFQQPEDCDMRIVCAETGLPPGENCRDKRSDYFIPLVSAAGTCRHMEELMISADGKYSFCRACVPATGYKREMFKVITPELRSWMDGQGIVYQQRPPHYPGCEEVFKNDRPMVLSPGNGSEYFVSQSGPEPLLLHCKAADDVSTVYWYIDNRFFKAAPANSRLYFTPEPGPVKISCTDDKGRNRDVWISVRTF